MTRETKIGLIVGMMFVLFIGILVSDYLAKTQQPIVPAMVQGQSSNDTDDRGDSNRSFVNRSTPLPNPGDSSENRQPQIDLTNRTNRHPDSLLLQRVDTRRSTPAYEPDELIIQPGQRDRHQLPNSNVQYKRHHVQQGESLGKIARKYYGDTNYWHAIAEANPGKVGANGSVRAGVMLLIPIRTATRTPSNNQPESQPLPRSQNNNVMTGRYREYTIKRGDVLSTLSQKFMGTSTKWRKLYELNKDRISNPDRLKPGTKIRVPVR